MARPERFELPTTWFVARYSIQLSYGRVLRLSISVVSPVPGGSTSPGRELRILLRSRSSAGSCPHARRYTPSPVRSLAGAKLCFAFRLAQLSYGRLKAYSKTDFFQAPCIAYLTDCQAGSKGSAKGRNYPGRGPQGQEKPRENTGIRPP